jgi:hypothetical protein
MALKAACVVPSFSNPPLLVTARISSSNEAGRTIEVAILMDLSGGGGHFEGHSQSVVLKEVVGGRRNLFLARLMSPSAVRRGGVIHFRKVEAGRVSGSLVIPRVAAPSVDATADGETGFRHSDVTRTSLRHGNGRPRRTSRSAVR